ncbi:hypothetical protein [Homoserinibacter sp. YIM 151385]|uniref:hypothetical protein n=1 Tax=Homoserinibacter sp. YIM 151385 TaxID=2985506 RepID=UPI0022F0A2F6|nr:hypothetical protein [Homoserinibacter sp. YIM 151385]WBU37179.1 hypothetical protein OF852_09630 [Homoserinibacter sp. YIM 151385]
MSAADDGRELPDGMYAMRGGRIIPESRVPIVWTQDPAARGSRAAESVGPTRLRFFLDWGGGIPIWWDFGGGGDDDIAALGLSDRLLEGLRAWQLDWERDFDIDTGFPTPELERIHWQTGDELLARLRAEVGDRAVVLDER